MEQIPDPTVDLDWSGYVGSIQERFREMAEKYPDRTCVVETKTTEKPERRFTYRQIYEASNILAHHLHDAGVTNGDVVMIWAHRSVDLVVSVMGTLASAATMSILDPAYPPARQQVYLEVSQPCALVQIARATDEAGPLAPQVRRYIDEELPLKVEVPSLRIGDDGILSGVETGNADIFAAVRPKATVPPAAFVGPDSNPTLSFTSGSEGRPKGVLGRAFSLAKYFGWMGQRFDLSAEGRWACLSGIAHDPIQRDIFTPLFFGGSIYIPSKDDIQHERLAEWMREYKPTVTHLTPAMGQVLVGGAVAKFDSLKTAFFVGDILTTRDCRRLRDLAKNATIVNLYGTTETQRSVSYYEVPCREKNPSFLDELGMDAIPSGKGMENVQLLVINREDRNRICKIGEVGEIYVRAAGLAEGYKGDQQLNDQKFLMNWFVDNDKWVREDKARANGEAWRKYYKGPRDRLYRTGDLGRYLETGDVVVVGRADDQVKIRGFRVELGDIDGHLSQNPLIRDCKTLVRRDRNEEPTLVSYVVPELTEWPQWLAAHNAKDIEEEGTDFGPARLFSRRFRRLQDELRRHLQRHLPAYAVPTRYIVLDKLPLNPNGKVDKPQLPFPDITEQVEEATEEELARWESLSPTEKSVAAHWAKLIKGLNSKTVSPQSHFFDLGAHSILAQQLLLNLRRDLNVLVPITTLYQSPTLHSFSAQVDRMLAAKTNAGTQVESTEANSDYSESLGELVEGLKLDPIPLAPALSSRSSPLTVLLTGATGFLGAYLIKELLERDKRPIKVIAHVRARDTKAGIERIKNSLLGYGIWRDEWAERLTCVVGDLSKPQLGVDQQTWAMLSNEVHVVIHNGATVSWVMAYEDMKATNVLSTLEALKLCNTTIGKKFTFVSSTSVLDTAHYRTLSQELESGVPEDDDLEGARKGLGTGYGQSKWVSERLVREAGKRGLNAWTVRPGYVLGDADTGLCNTDDFLIRMLKGCIQLSSRPRIANTINAVPVNHVARVVVATALRTDEGGAVVHVEAHPRMRMDTYLSALGYYGYNAPEVSYDIWKQALETYVSAGGSEKDLQQHALMPLYHFCVDDLPATTRAPVLNDKRAAEILKKDAENWSSADESAGHGVSREEVGRFLRYLIEIDFLGAPTGKGAPLPSIQLTESQVAGAVGGRGGVK